jgi:hypothetical protein
MAFMKSITKGALIATVAAGALVATASTAFADVACNRWGECWHVRDHYNNYPSELGISFHDEDWRRHNRWGHYRWRGDREDDRGYYREGRWTHF